MVCSHGTDLRLTHSGMSGRVCCNIRSLIFHFYYRSVHCLTHSAFFGVIQRYILYLAEFSQFCNFTLSDISDGIILMHFVIYSSISPTYSEFYKRWTHRYFRQHPLVFSKSRDSVNSLLQPQNVSKFLIKVIMI